MRGQREISRPDLKLEFFTSNHQDLRPFLVEKFGSKKANNGHITKNTKGRALDKRLRREAVIRNVKQQMAANMVGRAKAWMDNMILATMAHGNSLIEFDENKEKVLGFTDLKEALASIEAVRMFLGLPTSIRDRGLAPIEEEEQPEKLTQEEKDIVAVFVALEKKKLSEGHLAML